MSNNKHKEKKNVEVKVNSTELKKKFNQKVTHFIGKFKEAPKYMADNAYIHTGYRINYNNFKKAFKSMFMLHNETGNIWTHLLGFIFVVVLMIYVGNSYNFLDVSELKNKIAIQFYDNYEPIYKQFKQFDSALNEKMSSGFQQIQDDYEDFNKNIHNKLQEFLDEIYLLKEQNIDQFTLKAKEFPKMLKYYFENVDLNSLKSRYENLDISFLDRLKEMMQNQVSLIEENLHFEGFRNRILQKIDSEEFDWIDIVHFISKQDHLDIHTQSVSRWPIIVYLITAGLCLLFSATFHLVYVISPKVNTIFLRLDYAGVCLLISGSTLPLYYYGFQCEMFWGSIYITIIMIACLIVFFVSLQDFIHTPEYLSIKSWMYALLGIGAALPILHLMIMEYGEDQNASYSSLPSVGYYAWMGFFYLFGLYLYTKRLPEKMYPGKCDICGSSHQLWHIAIIIAIILTYFGGIINYHTRIQYSCNK